MNDISEMITKSNYSLRILFNNQSYNDDMVAVLIPPGCVFSDFNKYDEEFEVTGETNFSDFDEYKEHLKYLGIIILGDDVHYV